MLRRDIAAYSLKILYENFNPLKSYGKTNMTVFVLSLWEKYRWGITSFNQFTYAINLQLPFLNLFKRENGCRNYFLINFMIILHESYDSARAGTQDPWRPGSACFDTSIKT